MAIMATMGMEVISWPIHHLGHTLDLVFYTDDTKGDLGMGCVCLNYFFGVVRSLLGRL